MNSARHLRDIHKVSRYRNGGNEVIKPKRNTHKVSLMSFCLKLYKGEEEVKMPKFLCTYFMDGFLHTLSHMRLRLIKSSFDLSLSKAL